MRYSLIVPTFLSLAAAALAAPPRPTTLQGTAYGGQQPVSGAHVYLFSPGTTPGAASQSLLNAGSTTQLDGLGYYLTTDSGGNWSANGTGVYTCQAGAPVYAYARFGNSMGGSPSVPNNAISLMAYLGLCGSISGVYANIDEVTTIVMAYALAGFAADPTHISYNGSSSLASTAIKNAFATAANMVNLSAGTALTSNGSMTIPQATINTLADAIATCVNTASSTSSPCTSLFNATTSNGQSTGSIPSDTATAALNIAHNPWANVAFITYLPAANAPFEPTLGTAPNDLTLRLTYSGGGIGDATALAVDGVGNVWVASNAPGWINGTPSGSSSVVEIASAQSAKAFGTFLSPSSGFAASEFGPRTLYAIAVDPASTSVWVATGDTLEQINSSSGALATGSPWISNSNPYYNGGYSLSIDGSGTVWVAAYSSIYAVSSTGALISPVAGYSAGNDSAGNPNVEPSALAVDSSGNVWIADEGNSVLIEMTPSGVPSTVSAYAGSLLQPDGLAVDSSNNLWIANYGNNKATEYSQISRQFVSNEPNGYTLNSSTSLTGNFVAMDGASNSWFAPSDSVCNGSTACIGTVELSSSGTQLSGSNGYTAGGYNASVSSSAVHYGSAVDASGNVWIANTSADSVTELVGAALPVVTPLAYAVQQNSIGRTP